MTRSRSRNLASPKSNKSLKTGKAAGRSSTKSLTGSRSTPHLPAISSGQGLTTHGPPLSSLPSARPAGDTSAFMSAMQEGRSNVLVALRVRPLLPKEIKRGDANLIRVMDNKMVVLMDPGTDEDDFLRRNRSREARYAFDLAFPESAPSSTVYESTTRFLLEGIMQGFNATVFAYGATGAGKTHTMIGNDAEPGLIFLTLQELFDRCQNAVVRNYTVSMSYLEVYNENIRDLLVPKSNDFLDLRDDPIKGVSVAGVSEHEVGSAQEVMDLLHYGSRHRTTEPTAMNAVSSRSHAVLQVTVSGRDSTANTKHSVCVGKLSMIDLAGSERAANTSNRGQRLVEGANINRSLLALGNCIRALADSNARGKYINYRDSKLTRLLKDSLGGNCRTVMIANVSPVAKQFEETHNTLKYANRAKNIKTKTTRNVLNVSYHIAQYTQIISDLRAEIDGLKEQLAGSGEGEGEGMERNTVSPSQAMEKEEMQRLRDEIISNFHERMQLRRSLIDLEDLALQNAIEINKRHIEISKWMGSHPDTAPGELPQVVREVQEEVVTIQRNARKNKKLRKRLLKRLKENEDVTQRLREELPKRITNEDYREFLQLEYRIKGLELENMELEESNLLRDLMVKQKDLEIKKLELRLEISNRIINDQRSVLAEHNLPNSANLPSNYTDMLQDAGAHPDAEESFIQSSMAMLSAARGGPSAGSGAPPVVSVEGEVVDLKQLTGLGAGSALGTLQDDDSDSDSDSDSASEEESDDDDDFESETEPEVRRHSTGEQDVNIRWEAKSPAKSPAKPTKDDTEGQDEDNLPSRPRGMSFVTEIAQSRLNRSEARAAKDRALTGVAEDPNEDSEAPPASSSTPGAATPSTVSDSSPSPPSPITTTTTSPNKATGTPSSSSANLAAADAAAEKVKSSSNRRTTAESLMRHARKVASLVRGRSSGTLTPITEPPAESAPNPDRPPLAPKEESKPKMTASGSRNSLPRSSSRPERDFMRPTASSNGMARSSSSRSLVHSNSNTSIGSSPGRSGARVGRGSATAVFPSGPAPATSPPPGEALRATSTTPDGSGATSPPLKRSGSRKSKAKTDAYMARVSAAYGVKPRKK